MPPPDPTELLDLAKRLALAEGRAVPTDTERRRAVSTVYYAVFHKILGAATRRFMGAGQEIVAGFGILYRSFDHRHMKTACEALRRSTLNDRFSRNLHRTTILGDIREFADAFPVPQNDRHLADYDPAAEFSTSNVASLVSVAEAAMPAFDRTDPEEQADVLALLMVRTRD